MKTFYRSITYIQKSAEIISIQSEPCILVSLISSSNHYHSFSSKFNCSLLLTLNARIFLSTLEFHINWKGLHILFDVWLLLPNILRFISIFAGNIDCLGISGSWDDKESSCNAADPGLIPGWGRLFFHTCIVFHSMNALWFAFHCITGGHLSCWVAHTFSISPQII